MLMTVIEDTVGLPGITNLTVDSVAASLNQRYLIGSSDDFGELPKNERSRGYCEA